MSIKRFVALFMIALMLFPIVSLPGAQAVSINSEEITLFIDSRMTAAEEEAIWGEFFDTPNATLVVLFDEYSIEDIISDNGIAYGWREEICPLDGGRGVGVGFTYRVIRGTVGSNRADLSRSFGSTNGTPGHTLQLSRTNTISNSVTATFGAPNNTISSAVGFNVTAANSITNGTSRLVPATHGGRSVRTMTITAHPYISTTTFRTYRRSEHLPSTAPWEFRGSGTATRQLGVAFRDSFTFW